MGGGTLVSEGGALTEGASEVGTGTEGVGVQVAYVGGGTLVSEDGALMEGASEVGTGTEGVGVEVASVGAAEGCGTAEESMGWQM